MRNTPPLKAIAIVMVVGFALYYSCTSNAARQPQQEIGFSEFMQGIDTGWIQSVTLTGNKASGETNSGEQFHTYVPIQYEGFANYLVERGVRVNAKDTTVSPWAMMFSSLVPFLLIIGFFIFFIRQMQGKATGFTKSKATVHLPADDDKNKKTFADVSGVDEAKEELQEIVEFLKNPGKFTTIGGHIPKGILLIGQPGTGKTLLAKAVAGEANVPFYSISGSSFVEMFVGVGASRVRDLFEQGKKNAPCIIFIDELDAVGRQRGTGLGGGHDEREQTLNQILVEMDGFEANSGIITIAATNRPDVLDPALLRPGRFDRRVVVDKPDVRGRQGILNVHTKTVVLDDDIDLSIIAKGTAGFTGADLANLVNEAALHAAKEDEKKVTLKHFEWAKDKVLMGGERRSMLLSDEEKQVLAIHESGHTIVALFMPESDPIHKVTIIPRGMSLGSTHQLPTDDKHSVSREYLKSRIAVLMGGRIAEEIFNLGKITTGAGNDIEVATKLARKMVCEWGMSSKLGPVKYEGRAHNPFLGKTFSEPVPDYSENTAQQVDAEIKALIDEGTENAKKILEPRKNLVKVFTEKLRKKEVLDAEEIKQLAESTN